MTHHSEMLERKALTDYVRAHAVQADLDTLRKMGELLDNTTAPAGEQATDPAVEETLAETPEGQQLSRRSFVRGLATAGVAGVTLAGVSSVVSWGLGGRRTGQALQASNEARVNQLQGLVDLYQQLERVGLDQIVTLGLDAVGAIIQVVVLAAQGLRAGLDAARTILRSLAEAGPALQAALGWAGQIVSSLAVQLQNLEHTLQQTLQQAQPITDALGGFFNVVISRLPGPTGDRVRAALAQINAIIQAIPDFIHGLDTRVIQPLSADWFNPDPAKGLTGRLITPIVTQLLDPLDGHLAHITNLEQTWQTQLAGPVRQAIDQRHAIRQQITAYREENNLV